MKTPEESHVSLERELRRLSEQYSWEDAPPAVKNRIRIIKNRLSAQRSREQARKYVEKLEGTVKVLSEESVLLARRLAKVNFPQATTIFCIKSIRMMGCTSQSKVHPFRVLKAESLPWQVEAENRSLMEDGVMDATDSDAAALVEKHEHAEPAALKKPSLQLDALMLLLQAVAASSGPATPSGTLLQQRAVISLVARTMMAKKRLHTHLHNPQVLRTKARFLRARLRQSILQAACRTPVRSRRLGPAVAIQFLDEVGHMSPPPDGPGSPSAPATPTD